MVLRHLRSRTSIPASISSTGKVALFRKQASAGTFHRENKHTRPFMANNLQKHDKTFETQQVKHHSFCFESIIIKKPINLIIRFVNYKAQTDCSLLFIKYSNMLSAYTPTFSTQLENFSAEYPSAVPVRSFLSEPEECCPPSFPSPASACPAPQTIPTGLFPVD